MDQDKDFSFDDFSYRPNPNIAQESDTEGRGTLGVGSVREDVVYPPRVENLDSQGYDDVGLSFRNDECAPHNGPYHTQSAKVKHYDSSSSSDEPEEETSSYGSTDAFASSGGKNMKTRVRSREMDPQIPDQIMHFIVPNNNNEGLGYKSDIHAMAMSNKSFEIGPESCPSPNTVPMLSSISNSEQPRELLEKELVHGSSLSSVRVEMHYGVDMVPSADNTEVVYRREMIAFNTKRVHNPEYRTHQARLSSFINWPHVIPAAGEMANAGLFHVYGDAEAPDLVQCYKCGQYLENFTPADNPAEEHDKHFPGCMTIKWV